MLLFHAASFPLAFHVLRRNVLFYCLPELRPMLRSWFSSVRCLWRVTLIFWWMVACTGLDVVGVVVLPHARLASF